MLSKYERIELRKQEIGSKRTRKLRKYSESFNNIFSYFLNSYRKGILDFPGSIVDVKFDINAEDGKFVFREYEDGKYKNQSLISRHPNITKAVISAKKSFGLITTEYSLGIAEGSFLIDELLSELEKINTPQSLLKDFLNKVYKKRLDFCKIK